MKFFDEVRKMNIPLHAPYFFQAHFQLELLVRQLFPLKNYVMKFPIKSQLTIYVQSFTALWKPVKSFEERGDFPPEIGSGKNAANFETNPISSMEAKPN